MITVQQAQKIILKHSRKRRTVLVRVADALGSVLAEKVRVPVPLPHWDNSAMDGFALRAEDTRDAQSQNPLFLKITGVLRAGDQAKKILKSGEAVGIMTGAPVPRGADTILTKEMACVEKGSLKISQPLEKGRHIRKQGEEIRKGTVLHLQKVPVNSGTIAFLAQIGRMKVRVFNKPRIAILTTGSELIPPGKKLLPGKIYDSNSPMLAAALVSLGIRPQIVKTLRDERSILHRALRQALHQSDIVLLTGGVSVGDYDFSKTVLKELGVRTLFWKISQKPGKPLYFGNLKSKLIFGLPGNPASAHMCFYEYVLPAIRNFMGFANPFLERQKTAIRHDVKQDSFKTLFLKSKFGTDGRLSILPHQASHMISSLHETNGFLVVPPRNGNSKKRHELFMDKLP